MVETYGTVRALKTASPKGARSWTAGAAGFAGEKGTQATCYAWARREVTGEIPSAVAFDVVVKPECADRPVRVETVTTTRTAARLDWSGRELLPGLVRQAEAAALAGAEPGPARSGPGVLTVRSGAAQAGAAPADGHGVPARAVSRP